MNHEIKFVIDTCGLKKMLSGLNLINTTYILRQ